MQDIILNEIVKLGGKVLSDSEFYFPHKEFTKFHYEDCPEAGDWVAYPIDNPDFDMSLLIITPDMLENLNEKLVKYFEV